VQLILREGTWETSDFEFQGGGEGEEEETVVVCAACLVQNRKTKRDERKGGRQSLMKKGISNKIRKKSANRPQQ